MEQKQYDDLLAKGCDLIQKLDSTFKSSSSFKFGSFILLASPTDPSFCEPYLDPLFCESYSDPSSPSCEQYLSKPSFLLLSSSDSESVSESGSSGSGGSNDQEEFKLESLGLPPLDDDNLSKCSKKEVVGSCNGLVCLCDTLDHQVVQVYLWNPATKQQRILPEPEPEPIEMVVEEEDNYYLPSKQLLAFGFDIETKDYKVILLASVDYRVYASRRKEIKPPVQVKRLCRVQVYSLSTDSWRLLEGITSLPGDPFLTKEVLYLNGSCFFLAHFFHTKQQPCIPENNRFIISFDFTKEIITPIQLPDHHLDHYLCLTCLGDDKLALFTVCFEREFCQLPPHPSSDDCSEIYQPPRCLHYSENYFCEDYNMWVLDEQVSSSSSVVKKESWRGLHSFQIQHERPGEWSIPSCISNDGKFISLLFEDSTGVGNRIKLYNLVTKEVKLDFLSGSVVMSKAIPYKPSLVSIDKQQQPIE